MPIDARDLIAKMEWAAANDLRELHFCLGRTQVKIRRGEDGTRGPEPVRPLPAGPETAAAPDAAADVLTAPLAGLCHLGPEAGSAPFVAPGDGIAEGQTLCVIEAMKVMTPIPAPRAGTLAEILVAEGETVAVGAPLMRLA